MFILYSFHWTLCNVQSASSYPRLKDFPNENLIHFYHKHTYTRPSKLLQGRGKNWMKIYSTALSWVIKDGQKSMDSRYCYIDFHRVAEIFFSCSVHLLNIILVMTWKRLHILSVGWFDHPSVQLSLVCYTV